MKVFVLKISVFLILIFLSTVVRSQSIMSFVTLPPDARSLALGGATTALSPESFSALRNPAQLVFLKGRVGAGYGYMPWMKDLHADLDLHVATACLKIDHKQAVSVSCRYFSHMESEWTDDQGNVLGIIEPRDVALDFSYSRMIIRNLTGAITGRYISSYTGLGETMQAIAVDAAFLYRHVCSDKFVLSAGMHVSNVGCWSSDEISLPWNIRVGGSLDFVPSRNHSITVTTDVVSTKFQSVAGCVGMEYEFFKLLAFRCGYHWSEQHYGSVGVGIHWKYLAVDLGYVVAPQHSVLHKTWMLSTGIYW